MPDGAPKRRITIEVDYFEEDEVGLVLEGHGELRQIARGYLVADEANVVRFVSKEHRDKDAPTGA